MINLLKEKYTAHKNRGFTLIELIVVMAVIAVLVLLAAPRFMGHTEKAKVAQIQNDVRVAEMKVSEALIDGTDVWKSWSDDEVPSETLKGFIHEDGTTTLYGKGGPIKDKNDVDNGRYRVLPRTFIEQEVRSRLDGTFYANDKGTVYYERGVAHKGDAGEEEPGYSDEETDDLVYRHEYIPVATADELNSIRKDEELIYGKGTKWEGPYTGGLDKHYVQVANIDLSEYSGAGWTPIGTTSSSFTGTYNGGNYVITDLGTKGADKDYQGLFGYTEGATISNVGLIGNKVTGKSYVGGLVGYASSSTINNSYTTGSVTGTGTASYFGSGGWAGGLVGLASGGTIENSYSTGSVTGSGNNIGGLLGYAREKTEISNSYATGAVEGSTGVGGLVGYAYSEVTIENSYATGVVISGNTVSDIGGLVGRAQSGTTISNSYATGEVTGTGNYAGGLVGRAEESTTISNSYATGSVTGRYQAGGLVGWANRNTTIRNSYATGSVTGNEDIGGLMGAAYNSTIENSYAIGSVTGTKRVGSLVGYAYSSNIRNSYSTGSVKGSDSVGGLAGHAKDSTIENSYATGSVEGTNDVGGLVGWDVNNTSTISNSYWDRQTTGQSTSDGGTGKTTDEMKNQATYTGWDFESTWKINEGDYPKLR